MTSLSAYEQQRNANIAANNLRLKELGLIGMRLCVSEPAKPPVVRSTPVKRKPQSPPRTARVLRARTSIKPTLDSTSDNEDKPARRKGRVIVVDDDADEERLVELGALPDFVSEAEEAGEIVPQRGGVVYVKAMMPSHVSGGYWLQAPSGLLAVMPSVTCNIVLRVGASLWEVVWLLRDKQAGAGFSGGWRGFAVDQRLCVGDSVLFQQREPANPRVLDVHIFRKHLLGDEFKAMDAAFELVDALVDEDADGAAEGASELPRPSLPTRPALHWHSKRAKPQRRQLPCAVRLHATEREKAKEHECERSARMALGGDGDEAPADAPLMLPPLPPPQPQPVSRALAMAPDAPISPVPAVSPPHSPSPSADAEADADTDASMAAAEELAPAPAPAPAPKPSPAPAPKPPSPASATASDLAVGSLLWGAPLAHGEPHASDFDYFVVTRVPSRLDDNYHLLTSRASDGKGAARAFTEMRSGKAKLVRRSEPATAAHPRGGVNGAEATRLRAEAERRASGEGGVEGRRGRREPREPLARQLR